MLSTEAAARRMFDGSVVPLSFNALNFPLHLAEEVSRHRIHVRPRPSPASSPLLLRVEDSNGVSRSKRPGPPVSSPILNSPNSIGVLGGVSAVSTIRFLEKLVRSSSSGGGGGGGGEDLPFVVCNDPVLNGELDRCSILYRSASDGRAQPVRSIAVESLRRKRAFLERAGARCIAMPCHLAHAWHGEIAEGCSVPFLDAGDCVAKELKAANLKPVEMGSSVRVGVLATDASVVARFYQEKLESQGFEVLLPDKATMEHMVEPAMEAFERKDMEGARNLLMTSIDVLLVRAVSSIILASDYMQELLPEDDPLMKRCIDPMDALVRGTLHALGSVTKNGRR